MKHNFKRTLSLALCLVMVIGLLTAVPGMAAEEAPAPSDNWIVNSDFEGGTYEATFGKTKYVAPVGWGNPETGKPFQAVGAHFCQTVVDDPLGVNGKILMIEFPKAGFDSMGMFSDLFAVTPGQKLTISYEHLGTGEVGFFRRVLDANMNDLSTAWMGGAKGSDTAWNSKTLNYTVPADAAYISFAIYVGAANYGMLTCIDNIVIKCNHTYAGNLDSGVEATAASCAGAATNYIKCDSCNWLKKDDATQAEPFTIEVGTAKEHSFTTKASATVAAEATCDTAATYYVQCDTCDAVSETLTVAVGEAKGHSFTTKASTTIATAGDCSTAATYYVQCDNCEAIDETKTVEGAAPDHQWNEGEVTTAPTCEEKGEKTFTCTVEGCTGTKTEEVAATGHTLTAVEAKEATVDAEGNTAYWTCECGKWFADAEGKTEITDKASVVIPKLDPPTEPSEPGDVPPGGDETALALMMTLLVLSCAALVVTKAKFGFRK